MNIRSPDLQRGMLAHACKVEVHTKLGEHGDANEQLCWYVTLQQVILYHLPLL